MYIILGIERSKKFSIDPCLTMISFLRSFRILRFARQITDLKIFLRSIIYGFRELVYLFLILITIILFFGEFVYLLEQKTIDSSIRTVTGNSPIEEKRKFVFIGFLRWLLADCFNSNKSWLW